MTFSQAQAYCQSKYGGNLASITSAEENAIIGTMCENINQLQSACWLGLSTPFTTFYDGSSVTYSDAWYTGEPDGYSSQPCTTIRTGGLWFTVGYCETDPLPFICEYEPQQKLIFVPTPATLDEAINDCRTTYDGDLASIHSADDNTAYATACQDIGQFQSACLLGLNNPPIIWSDGSSIDYTNWYTGEPDGGAAQPVVSIRQGGDWHTIGQVSLPYVCYGYQVTDAPSSDPTADPTSEPTTMKPSFDPTSDPTADPTNDPTFDPTTSDPTNDPTMDPTAEYIGLLMFLFLVLKNKTHVFMKKTFSKSNRSSICKSTYDIQSSTSILSINIWWILTINHIR